MQVTSQKYSFDLVECEDYFNVNFRIHSEQAKKLTKSFWIAYRKHLQQTEKKGKISQKVAEKGQS